ncbi:MAG: thiol reductant exporter subunit CydC [Actinomycetota bacterium]
MPRTFKQLIKLGLPKDRFFGWGLVVSVLQGLSAVSLLAVSAWLISRAAEVNSIVYLGIAIVGVRGFAVGRATFRYSERLLLHESAFRLLASRRSQLFERLVPFIPAGMSQVGRGESMARVVNDIDELQNLPLRVVAPVVQAIVVAVASVLFMWLLLPEAGLALFLVLIAAFFVAIPLGASLATKSDSYTAPLRARMSNVSLDLLENLDVYIAYGWVEAKRAEINRIEVELRRAIIKSAVSNGLGASLFTLLSIVSVLAGAWFGGVAVSDQSLPGASLAVFVLVPLAIFEVLQSAQPALSAFRKFKVSAHRVSELLDREVPRVLQLETGNRALEHFDSIELRSVSITYPEALEPALENFDLTIRPGESVMLFGESGAGKSSVALLLSRLIQPSSGEYLINGEPAGVFASAELRRSIGLVEQNPMVFLGNVRANLRIAKHDATDAELRDVLDQVGLWSMFAAREGLDTQLGDRGVLISGGEAQRLALARAILAQFQVLILDEPTANVDADTAGTLIADMLRVARGSEHRAVVLISHDERFRKLVDRAVKVAKK